jgi:hypothetical protein
MHHSAALLALLAALRRSLRAIGHTLAALPAGIFDVADGAHARWAARHGAVLASVERNAAKLVGVARRVGASPAEAPALGECLEGFERKLRELATKLEVSRLL